MREEFFHFLWKYQLYEKASLCCTSGERVVVHHPGSHNFDAGPDFFNAKIQIGDEFWVGNVEVHVRASDWTKHNHQLDKVYDSVILHVVGFDDKENVVRTNGSKIYCLQLDFDRRLEERYEAMVNTQNWIPCEQYLKNIDHFQIRQMMGRLLVENLGRKTELIELELLRTQSSWEEVFYFFLFKSFGFSLNSLPLELLAKSLPYRIILKHRGSLLSIEALLFGQAGLLTDTLSDSYCLRLKREYDHLKNMHGLKPIDRSLWKFLRIRPNNFPTLRIAQIAGLLYRHVNLFSSIIECRKIGDFQDFILKIPVSPYWESHYTLGKESRPTPKNIGYESFLLLAINLWIPFLFAYAHLSGNLTLKEDALNILDQLKPENNRDLRKWKELGIPINSAFDSQALIYLKKEYCLQHKCLQCSLGKKLVEAAHS